MQTKCNFKLITCVQCRLEQHRVGNVHKSVCSDVDRAWQVLAEHYQSIAKETEI